MKAKNLIIAMLVAVSGSFLYGQKGDVNITDSDIEWHGKKIGTDHHGKIYFKSGSIELKDDQIVAGNFVVDMTSITNIDLDNETYNQKLVGHLKSDDFFGVEKYPTASFILTQSSKFSNGKATLSGDITIKDKTEPITFQVKRTGNEFNAKVDIDRSKFDVRFGSDSFFDNLGDKAIDDIFTLDIKLVLK